MEFEKKLKEAVCLINSSIIKLDDLTETMNDDYDIQIIQNELICAKEKIEDKKRIIWEASQ